MRRQYIRGPFWTKVNKDGPTPEHCPEIGPCWVWIAGTDSKGYGQVADPLTRRAKPAHRVSWAEANGPIPAGLSICHHCDNPPCVRPEHLFLGTVADNVADMFAKGRGNRQYGEARPGAKLTDDLVRAIRYQFDVEHTRIVDIARQRGLDQDHVWKVVHRKKWCHIP